VDVATQDNYDDLEKKLDFISERVDDLKSITKDETNDKMKKK